MSGHGHDDANHGHDEHDHGPALGASDPARKQSFLEKIFLPEIVKGLANTFMHMFAKQATMEYDGSGQNKTGAPSTMDGGEEKRHIPRPGYRGEHYLKKDEAGHVKCVACFMCAAACPAECIHIEAEATPPDWKDRERYPKRFEIDLLRCIYCGYCEEACPVDAIALSSTFNVVSSTREEKIYDCDRLLVDGEKYGLSLSHHQYRPDGVPGALPAPKEH